ncbi:hypothetical protein MHYP_G00210230 [Metynnis hypsauchen]
MPRLQQAADWLWNPQLDIDKYYLTVTETLRCTSCKATHLSSSKMVLNQLALPHWSEFRIILIHKYACDISIIRMINERTLVNSSHRLLKQLKENHSEEWLICLARYFGECEPFVEHPSLPGASTACCGPHRQMASYSLWKGHRVDSTTLRPPLLPHLREQLKKEGVPGMTSAEVDGNITKGTEANSLNFQLYMLEGHNCWNQDRSVESMASKPAFLSYSGDLLHSVDTSSLKVLGQRFVPSFQPHPA